jgi:hypothetical protein
MLEKEILEKMIELLPVGDIDVARKMLERSGVRFIFAGGKSGTYSAGMLKLDEVGGVVDFNVGAITGFIMADDGPITSGLDVDTTKVVQDLRNQLVQVDDAHRQETNALHKKLAENNKLLAYADQRLEEYVKENSKDAAPSGEGAGISEDKLAASGEGGLKGVRSDLDPSVPSGEGEASK